METYSSNYPAIVKVEYFDSSRLNGQHVSLRHLAGLNVSVPKARFNLPLIEPGTCEVKSSDGMQSVSLKFSSTIKIYPRFRPSFIFWDADNRSYLIPADEKPFPKVHDMRTFGSLPDSRPEVSYEITHTSVCTPIEVFL